VRLLREAMERAGRPVNVLVLSNDGVALLAASRCGLFVFGPKSWLLLLKLQAGVIAFVHVLVRC
jgi:hypothetical protein